MTTKDYELLATSFGSVLRGLRDNSPTDEKLAGFWLAINTFTSAAQNENPNFSRERFTNAVINRSL